MTPTFRDFVIAAMIHAADGYADDEVVRYNGELWLAGRLREEADDMIEAS